MKCKAGRNNGNAKLDDEAVWEIRRARQGAGRMPSTDPRSVAALAKRFGVRPAAISKIALGQRWGHHMKGERP